MEPQSDQESNKPQVTTITDDKLRSGGFAFAETDGATLMFNFAPNPELTGRSSFAPDPVAPTVTTKKDESAIESTLNMANVTEFSFDLEQYRSTKNPEQTMATEGVGTSQSDSKFFASPIFSMDGYAGNANLNCKDALPLPLGTAGGSENVDPLFTDGLVIRNPLSLRLDEEQGNMNPVSCASEAEAIYDSADDKDIIPSTVPRANVRPIAKLSARKARKLQGAHDSNTLDATVFASLVQQMKLKFEKDTRPPLIDMDKRTALDHIKRLEDKLGQIETQAHSTNRDDINLNHEDKKLNMLKERDTSSDETNRGMDISWDVVCVKFKKELDEHVTEELKKRLKESLPSHQFNKTAFGEDRGLDSNIMTGFSVSHDGTRRLAASNGPHDILSQIEQTTFETAMKTGGEISSYVNSEIQNGLTLEKYLQWSMEHMSSLQKEVESLKDSSEHKTTISHVEVETESNAAPGNHQPNETLDAADTDTGDSDLERDLISAMKAMPGMNQKTSISSASEKSLEHYCEQISHTSEMEQLERSYKEVKAERDREIMEAQQTRETHQQAIWSLKEEKEHSKKLSELVTKLETNIEALIIETTKNCQQIAGLESKVSRAKDSVETAAQQLGFSYTDDCDLAAYIRDFINELLDLYHKSDVTASRAMSLEDEQTRRLADEAAEITLKVSGSVIRKHAENISPDRSVETLTQYFEASEEYCRDLYMDNLVLRRKFRTGTLD